MWPIPCLPWGDLEMQRSITSSPVPQGDRKGQTMFHRSFLAVSTGMVSIILAGVAHAAEQNAVRTTERVVYYDATQEASWVNGAGQVADWFKGRGFTARNAGELASWMEARTGGAYGSVVVMAMGTVPAGLLTPENSECLLRSYLDAGGRVVWMGDAALAVTTVPGQRQVARSGVAGVLKSVLDVDFVWDEENANLQPQLTAAGQRWGVPQGSAGSCVRAVEAESVTACLSSCENSAAIWLKNTNPEHPLSGFIASVHVVDGSNPETFAEFYPLATFDGAITGPVATAAAVPDEPPVRWRVVEPKYPCTDVVVAGCTVREAGAKGDGATDDTAAFQAAMRSVAKAGGGAVFVPAGWYAIRGNLTVPQGVTLRGELETPDPARPLRGTVLMAFAGRGAESARPFISLRPSSGLKGLAIWYPEQQAGHITPYPFSVRHASEATVEGVVLVNAYQGINIGPGGNGTHIIRNVYGTPLATGIQIDNCFDTGRIENVRFMPDYWSASGLPGAPAADGPHTQWLRANGVALRLFRIDWECLTFVKIRGYKIGAEVLPSRHNPPINNGGPPYGHFYGCEIVDCTNAFLAADARFPGFLFAHCVLGGTDAAIKTAGTFTSFLGLHSCTLRGNGRAVDIHGTLGAAALFQRCDFSGEAAVDMGSFSMLGCKFGSPNTHLSIGPGTRVATIAGSAFNGAAEIRNASDSEQIRIGDAPLPESPRPPVIPWKPDRALKPAKPDLYVVTDPAWGARKDAFTDDTAAIQKALTAAGQAGGGVVFLPGGEYAIHGNLTVPSGVELRGTYDVSNKACDRGSIVRVFTGRGKDDGPSLIVMAKHSGIRGLIFVYPEQTYGGIVPYPFTIQGRGEDVYVVNVTGGNPYKFLDFMSYRCDRHCLDRVFGAPLKVGIAIGGGSVGGEVRNANLNPGWWTFSHFRDCPGTPPPGTPGQGSSGNPVVTYVEHHLDALVYGDCTGELEFNSAVCPALYGVHFVKQNGRGPAVILLAHASDTAQVDALFDDLAPAGVDFINTNLAAYVPPDEQFCGGKIGSEARFFNTATWGAPDFSAVITSGRLLFEVACFNQYGPFVAKGGTIALTNARLLANVPGGEELRVSDGGSIELTGNTTLRGMRLRAGAPAKAVTARFETQWAPPAVATHEPPLARWLAGGGDGAIARDATGNGLDGKMEHVAPAPGPGRDEAAGAFDGNATVTISPGKLPELKAFTVEAWVFPEELGSFQNIVSWDGRVLLRINNAEEGNHLASFVALADGSMEPRANGPVAQSGVWQHVAAVWDGVCLQLWVDGRSLAEVSRTGRLGESKGPIVIGQGFRGRISDVKLYGRPVAEDEIRSHAGKRD